jgi:hypothetical protein
MREEKEHNDFFGSLKIAEAERRSFAVLRHRYAPLNTLHILALTRILTS